MIIPTYHCIKLENPEITAELDHLIACLPAELSNCDLEDFRQTSLGHAQKRTNEFALMEVMDYGDRNVAAYDENVIKLPKYWATELDRDFENIVKAFALAGGEECKFWMTGKFWYPSGGYMGWHTNNAFPGYRMYISKAREACKSFFRYKDPSSGEIKTSPDEAYWQARIFRIDPARPLWHCVCSETDRFSFGCNLFVKPGSS